RAMQDYLDMPNPRGRELALLVDLKPRLGEGERVVAVGTPEPRKARFLTGFAAAKERLEGQIKPARHVLQDLRGDWAQGGAVLLEHRIGGLLPIAGKRRALLLIRLLAHFQQVVIKPTALMQRLVEPGFLFLRGENPIHQHFT